MLTPEDNTNKLLELTAKQEYIPEDNLTNDKEELEELIRNHGIVWYHTNSKLDGLWH